jgi:hypothetical protein
MAAASKLVRDASAAAERLAARTSLDRTGWSAGRIALEGPSFSFIRAPVGKRDRKTKILEVNEIVSTTEERCPLDSRSGALRSRQRQRREPPQLFGVTLQSCDFQVEAKRRQIEAVARESVARDRQHAAAVLCVLKYFINKWFQLGTNIVSLLPDPFPQLDQLGRV